MKWFAHSCDERDRAFVDQVYEKFSHEGYAVWYQIHEVLGVEIEKELDEFEAGRRQYISPVMHVDVNWLSKRCRTSPETLIEFLKFCKLKGQLSLLEWSRKKDRVWIEVPNLLGDIDEYFKKRLREICAERKIDHRKVLRLSGVTPESVRSHSAHSRADDRTVPVGKTAAAPDGAKLGDNGGGEGEDEVIPPDPAAPPAPPPPPRAAAADACPAVAPEPSATGSENLDINRPHPLSVGLLLTLDFSPRQAKEWAVRSTIREVCAAVAAAQGGQVERKGAYAMDLLKRGHKRNAPMDIGSVAKLREEMRLFDERWRAIGGRGDPYEFGVQVRPLGHVAGIPALVRSFR